MDIPKILFLIDILYSTYGGAEGVLWRITRHLPRDRYKCVVATFASEPEEVVADRFKCPVHCFPIHRMWDWNAVTTAHRLSQFIREEKFSIVHTFFPASDLLGAMAARLAGCPVVISSRRDMGFQRTMLQRAAYRAARSLFTQVQTVGEQVRRRHIREDHLDPSKVVTVYNGVDLAQIDRAAPVMDIEDGRLVVSVANIRRVKALEMLLRTAAIVCKREPRTRFLVVGAVTDAPYYRELVELAKSLDIERSVVFTGACQQVPSLLKRCEVFCLLSNSEGFSNAMLEAMACRLPCVATATGGNTELVEEGTNGFLVSPNDPEAGAERLLRLLQDRPRARRMGEAGRRIVERHFTLDAMMTRMTALYDQLLQTQGEMYMDWTSAAV